jgi:hypothetical protein
MNLSTKKSFLSLLIATAFLTGCQSEQNSASDNQASTVTTSALSSKNTTLPYGRSKKITADPIIVEPVVADPIVADPIVADPIAVEPVVADPIVAEPQPVVVACAAGNANIEGLITDKATGVGLSNVQVNIGGCTTTTDAQGFYKLTNIISNDKAVVVFDAVGYARNSTIVQIDQYLEGTTTLSPNYLDFALDKYTNTNTGDSQNEMNWKVEYGFGLLIPGGIYTDTAGNAYTGQVTASRFYRKQTEGSKAIAFPGSYSGKNSSGVIVPFVSYGFVAIDLRDANGTALGVSDNITLTFPATGATDNILPLWYYDYDQGLWIEEGYAQLQADNSYMGVISHAGSWSLSKPIDIATGVYRGRIVDINKLPQGDVRISAVGDNWVSTDYSTDADGYFEIEVVPNSPFTLAAYHYKDNYGADYNGTIAAIASGNIVEEAL